MAEEIQGEARPAGPPAYAPSDGTPPASGPDFFDQINGTFTRLGMEAQAAAVQAESASGGGFSYTPEQLLNIATRFDQLAEEYEGDILLAERIVAAQGPGIDYASTDNASMISNSGRLYIAAAKERIAYCNAQAEKFRTAAGKYATNEDDATADIERQGGSV